VGRNIDRTKGKKVVTRQQRQAEASRFDIVGGRKIPSLPSFLHQNPILTY